jgi:hypothetical protein
MAVVVCEFFFCGDEDEVACVFFRLSSEVMQVSIAQLK